MKAGMDDGKNPIFDPRQLRPVDSVDFCGTCHGAWWDVRMQSMTGVITVRSQPYRLENSRCWGKGDARITCIACHDPHRPLVRDAASYDQRCLSCHLPSVDAKPGPDHPGAACKVSTKNCVTCHMPEVEVPELHYKFTDHQIRIVRSGAEFPN
jgi:formate-dependent nitrite reductase cytochrome c552 subunit